MNIVLSSNPYRDKGLRAAQEARKILEKAGAQVSLCLPFAPRKGERLELSGQLPLMELAQALEHAEILVCFGGDGTILHAARDAVRHNVPILGVNLGSVGFMAELERGELPLLTRLTAGEYRLEERMMLDVRILRGGRQLWGDLALNDCVVSKGSMGRVAELEVRADDVPLMELMGDGVITATPTGSTAYSMSAGGPILEPTTRSLIVTPVCAHQLSARPMVLSPERTVTIQLPKGSRKHLYLAVDGGKPVRLSAGERAEIRSSESVTRLIRLTERNFYQNINQKLGGYAT